VPVNLAYRVRLRPFAHNCVYDSAAQEATARCDRIIRQDMDLITDTESLAAACARLERHDFVTVDTEFLREHTFWPKVCLIQLAGPEDGLEMIVDPLAKDIDLAPFYRLMANPGVIKVFHAARQDVEIIYKGAGLIPQPLFDTQVAAMVCGFGESVGYVNLVKAVTNVTLDKGARFTDWSRRPLDATQLSYALADVTHLRDVYTELARQLDATGRASWLAEEMDTLTDPETYEVRPEDAWQRLKMKVRNKQAMAILMELAAWRERTAQDQDVPRSRVLRDDAVYDIANQAPSTAKQLGRLRSVSDGFERSQKGAEILAAVRAGQERDLTDVPSPKSGKGLSASEAALVDLLKVLLKATSARHQVAAKMIADTSDLERIASEAKPNVPALKGWRKDIFGDLALALKAGRVALSVQGGEVITVER